MLAYFKEKELYPEKLAKAVKNIDTEKRNVLCTHISIESVRNNDGSVVDDSHGVSLNLFSSFDAVIVGHYHNKQKFNNIYYIGSTFPGNFGEDNDKGIVLFRDGTLQYLPTDFTHYITKTYQVSTLSDVLALNGTDQREENAHVKVVIKGEASIVESIDKKSIKCKKIEVIKQDSTLEKQETVEVIHTESSREDAFKSYCEVKKLNYEEGIKCRK